MSSYHRYRAASRMIKVSAAIKQIDLDGILFYLTDSKSPGVFQFSLRLAYQREYRAVSSNGEVEAIGFAVGPGRDLFFASEDSLYVGKRP